MAAIDAKSLNKSSYSYLYNTNIYLVNKLTSMMMVKETTRDTIRTLGISGLYMAIRKYDLIKDGDFSKYALNFIIKQIKLYNLDNQNEKIKIDYLDSDNCLNISMRTRISIEEVLNITNYFETK